MDNWFKNIEFAWPWILWTLFIIPLIIAWYIKMNKRQTAALPITTLKHLKNSKGINTWLFHIPFILRCAGIIFLIIALARPQKIFTEKYLDGEGIDIILCIDVSGSMAYKDFLPTRLEASKEIVKDFVRSRSGDNIGVVIFSNYGFTLCPLTIDTNTVLNQIKSITDSILSDNETVIGTGIATCINRLKNSHSKSKVIILLSDGVNSLDAVSPETAIDIAKNNNIKIYTIGVGIDAKEVEVDIKVLGEITPHKVVSELNEVLLKRIAYETGGNYFHALDQEGLKKGYESINNLEKSKIQTIINNRYEDRYLFFLIVGFIFIFCELILRHSVFRKFP